MYVASGTVRHGCKQQTEQRVLEIQTPFDAAATVQPADMHGTLKVYFPVINATNGIHNRRALHDINEKRTKLACVRFAMISYGTAAS
jgi:hypothetical protein